MYGWVPFDESAATSVYLVCHPLQLCTGIGPTMAASPALDMSASVTFSCGNTSACVMKWLSERMCFRASTFSMLKNKLFHSQEWHKQTTY